MDLRNKYIEFIYVCTYRERERQRERERERALQGPHQAIILQRIENIRRVSRFSSLKFPFFPLFLEDLSQPVSLVREQKTYRQLRLVTVFQGKNNFFSFNFQRNPLCLFLTLDAKIIFFGFRN